jgi:hypothetical protein
VRTASERSLLSPPPHAYHHAYLDARSCGADVEAALFRAAAARAVQPVGSGRRDAAAAGSHGGERCAHRLPAQRASQVAVHGSGASERSLLPSLTTCSAGSPTYACGGSHLASRLVLQRLPLHRRGESATHDFGRAVSAPHQTAEAAESGRGCAHSGAGGASGESGVHSARN